eukprot:scaffold9468_cov130-Skeletonema_dohrnii-CCMP3373.AAC.4
MSCALLHTLTSFSELLHGWDNRIEWDYNHFKTIQKRDVGRWFGANNPPDDHACMPGLPDDVSIYSFT